TGDFYTNRWRIYDVGIVDFQTDLTGGDVCCYITPLTIKLTAANPYLYGPVKDDVTATPLNASALSDSTLVPFEPWLFGAGTAGCTTVTDPAVGTVSPIFTFIGGTTGIESGLVYEALGLYPSDGIWPDDCLFPADAAQQQVNGDC